MRRNLLAATLSTAALALASCGGGSSGGNGGGGGGGGGSTPAPTPAPTPTPTPTPAPTPTPTPPAPTPTPPAPTPTPSPTPTPTPSVGIQSQPRATYNEPWAIAFEPGTGRIFVTEKGGTMKFYDPATNNDDGVVTGLPPVAYGGQGGLGDVAFAPGYNGTSNRTIYLSWAEAGSGGTRGAAVGRGTLNCTTTTTCDIVGLTVIWRQNPKVSGTGHYSHKLEFSPNGQYLFITSGDRQLGSPAQDLDQNLGKFVRLNLDGSLPSDNPFGSSGVRGEIWSYGHRNILGIQFDSSGRLWGLEHGPMGGDELNLIRRGLNYGWPNVSNGSNYDGSPIPDHDPEGDDGYEPPAISWNPVIAPGDFIFYRGSLFPWAGQVIIAGMPTERLIRVTIGTNSSGRVVGTEVRRYQMNDRIRDIEEAPDGAIWVIEDGAGGRLLRLTPN